MNIAEQFIAKLVGALGLSPDDVKTSVESVVRNATQVRDEVLAAKDGFRKGVEHFSERLDRIEKTQAEILAELQARPKALPKPNGKGLEHD